MREYFKKNKNTVFKTLRRKKINYFSEKNNHKKRFDVDCCF